AGPGGPGYPPPGAPGQPMAPPPANASKNNVGVIVAVVIAVVLLVCVGAVGTVVWTMKSASDAIKSAIPTSEPTLYPTGLPTGSGAGIQVVYEVTGSGRARITYFDERGTSQRLTGESLPWKKELTVRSGMASVIASGENGAQVSCRLLVDGQERETKKGVVVNCADFSLPR
ncbi:MmpS family transport accessory protein, partial [Micromonospora zhanjiangensis]